LTKKENELNEQIALKRSIDMTVQELIDMNIDTTDLVKQSQEVGIAIQKAAVEYAKTKVDGYSKSRKSKQPLGTKLPRKPDRL
jgi:predicted ATP-grasp superfamily ATP-dependent carboligase